VSSGRRRVKRDESSLAWIRPKPDHVSRPHRTLCLDDGFSYGNTLTGQDPLDVNAVAAAIERYLHTGDYEHDHPERPGQSFWERAKNGHDDMLRALVGEVKRRSEGKGHPRVPELDLASWTHRKLTPMVHGFFPEAEREAVLALFEKSVVFLTSEERNPWMPSTTSSYAFPPQQGRKGE
jgi:hypothetical protein